MAHAHVTPATVKAMADRVLAMAGYLAILTPTSIDNKVVEALKNMNEQPWFAELIAMLINSFEDGRVHGDNAASVHEFLKKLV